MGFKLNNPLHGPLLLQHQVLQGNLIHMEGVKHPWKCSFQATGCFFRRFGILPASGPRLLSCCIISFLFLPGPQAYSLLCRQDSVLVYSRHPDILQVLKHCQVRPQPRHDSAPVLQSKIPGCIKGSHLNGPYGVRAQGHCPADNIINMSHRNQVAGMLVICHQHTPLIIGGLKQGHKCLQVPGSRALPYHNPLSSSKFFQSLPCI